MHAELREDESSVVGVVVQDGVVAPAAVVLEDLKASNGDSETLQW